MTPTQPAHSGVPTLVPGGEGEGRRGVGCVGTHSCSSHVIQCWEPESLWREAEIIVVGSCPAADGIVKYNLADAVHLEVCQVGQQATISIYMVLTPRNHIH